MAAIGKIRSWGPWLVGIIGLALFGFIATDFTRQCETSSNQARQQVGKVLGEKLSYPDLQQRAEEYKNLAKVIHAEPSEEVLREMAWSDFVNNTILAEEAEKLGLGVTKDELQAVLSQGNHPALPKQMLLKEFFTGDEFDYNNVMQQYTMLKQSDPEGFREFEAYWNTVEKLICQTLLVRKYQTLLQACMLTNEASAKIAFDGKNTETTIELASLPYSSINDNSVTITDADLQAKYDEMKEQFKWNTETRDVKYVLCHVTPSESDMKAITDKLADATSKFNSDSTNLAAIVNSHQSVIAYTENMPYNKNGLRAISPELLAAMDTLAEKSVTAPFKYTSYETGKPIEHMAVARLNRRYVDVDTIGFNYIGVGGSTYEDAEQRADSIIAVIKGGISIDSVATSFGQPVQKGTVSADIYQNNKNLNVDDKAVVNGIRGNKVGDLTRIRLSGGVLVCQVTETKNSQLYDVAIVSNEINFTEETEQKFYNDFSQYVSSCSNAEDLEKKNPNNAYTIMEQLNLRNTAQGIGTYGNQLSNTRELVKWAFAKADENSISEINYDPTEGRYLAVVVTKIHPVGYLDLKSVESTLRAEVLKDKKAEQLMKKLANVKTVQDAEKQGAMVSTIDGINFPVGVNVNGMKEIGLSGAVAATATGQTVKKPVKGTNGVFFFKVTERTPNAANQFDRRKQENELMRKLAQDVTPAMMEVLYEKAEVQDNRYLF